MNINFEDMDISKSTFKSLYDLSLAFSTERKCVKYLELHRWKDGIPVSPYAPTSTVYNRGDGMYRCKNTGKNFNVRTGTLFESSKTPLSKWFTAIWLIPSHKKRYFIRSTVQRHSSNTKDGLVYESPYP
jgi:transposase-like protein